LEEISAIQYNKVLLFSLNIPEEIQFTLADFSGDQPNISHSVPFL